MKARILLIIPVLVFAGACDETIMIDSPLVGTWREVGQYRCGSGEEIVPLDPILELVFEDDGTFSVTWLPFEYYKDYWGNFSLNPDQSTLNLSISYGNFVPGDFDGVGFYSIDTQGNLILNDLWLGKKEQNLETHCGHRFAPAR
ncbi:hypothetical protein ACFLU6_06575 [Acidobacteriota bacterium]